MKLCASWAGRNTHVPGMVFCWMYNLVKYFTLGTSNWLTDVASYLDDRLLAAADHLKLVIIHFISNQAFICFLQCTLQNLFCCNWIHFSILHAKDISVSVLMSIKVTKCCIYNWYWPSVINGLWTFVGPVIVSGTVAAWWQHHDAC